MEWTDTTQAITSMLGVLIGLGGLLAIIRELRGIDEDIRSNTRIGLYDMAARLKELFLDRPHLRPFFFENVEVPPGSPHFEEAAAAADYYCLYLEHVATQRSNFAKEDGFAWCQYLRDMYQLSPIIRSHLAARRSWYSDSLWKVIESRG